MEKKHLFEKIKNLLNNKKQPQSLTNNQPKPDNKEHNFTGYNVSNDGISIDQTRQKNNFETTNPQVTTNIKNSIKEDSIIHLLNFIHELPNRYYQQLPPCNITDSQWRLFLETAYDKFATTGLQGGYTVVMEEGINYVLLGNYPRQQPTITFQCLLENFQAPMIPPGIVDEIIQDIKKTVYLLTREDNTVNFQEYKNITRK